MADEANNVPSRRARSDRRLRTSRDREERKRSGVGAEQATGSTSRRPKSDRRHLLSRRPRDIKKHRIALAFIGFFLLAMIGTAVAIYAMVFVQPPKQLLVRVDDVKYTRGDMVKLLRAQQRQVELQGQNYLYGEQIFVAFQEIIDNEILAQAATRLGITASDEEVDQLTRALFTPPSDTTGADPTQLEQEFQERYRAFLNETGLSKKEHRRQVRILIQKEDMRQFIGESVPTVAEQVRLHRIIMGLEDEIEVMQVKYKDAVGESKDPERLREAFKELVREFSQDDPETIRKGGDLDWGPKGVLPDYDGLIFGLEVGELSEPTPNYENREQIFFFMVSEKAEVRELEEGKREILKSAALHEWLNIERLDHEIFAVFNSDVYAWLAKQLQLTTTTTPVTELQQTGF